MRQFEGTTTNERTTHKQEARSHKLRRDARCVKKGERGRRKKAKVDKRVDQKQGFTVLRKKFLVVPPWSLYYGVFLIVDAPCFLRSAAAP